MQTVLQAPTPQAWVNTAVERWREMLVDHANCEKKAASTALALIFAYPEDSALTMALSRLAREELRHFEQVQKMMIALGVQFERQHPGRYASGLRSQLRTSEPGRKLDLLLSGALIEARSAERFRLLSPRLQPPLAGFYAQLEKSEARHYELYLDLARAEQPQGWRERLRMCSARLWRAKVVRSVSSCAAPSVQRYSAFQRFTKSRGTVQPLVFSTTVSGGSLGSTTTSPRAREGGCRVSTAGTASTLSSARDLPNWVASPPAPAQPEAANIVATIVKRAIASTSGSPSRESPATSVRADRGRAGRAM